MKWKLKGATIAVIERKLKSQWNPEQIAGWLKKQGFKKSVSHETIYQYVWEDKRRGGLALSRIEA